MKTIQHLYKLCVIIPLLFTFSSCNDWLDLEPQDKLIRQEFWQKKEDVEGVVNAMYDTFREGSLESFYWGEVRADMIRFVGSSLNDYVRIASSDISPSNNAINWGDYYATINLANTILQFTDEVMERDESFLPEDKEGYEAEALFMRSLCYFYLVRLWKEVPIILEPSSSDTVNFFIAKSPEHEIISTIISDLKTAEEKAFTNKYIAEPAAFRGRANVHSIRALLADVYLWSEQYEECITYCDKIINSNQYVLMNESQWFFLFFPGNAAESIFEIQFNDAYEKEENPIHDELRKIGTYNNVLSSLYGIGDIRKLRTNNILLRYSGASLDVPRTDNQKDANFIYYRYADILLMKAEALAEQQQFNEANQLINEIVTRSGLPAVTLPFNLENFRNYILEERAREFAAEGKRWFDVLRFAKKESFKNKALIINMVMQNASAKERPILRSKVLDTMSYYLPIPYNDLLTNPELEQNPYYNR